MTEQVDDTGGDDENSKQAKPRKKFSRDRNGCITCRIRKIKCSLEKPNCLKCTSTGRKCDGYALQSTAHQRPQPYPELQPQKALDTPSSLGRTYCEKLCLDFFYNISAPSYVNFGSHYFWNSLVIQACFHDDAIRHLVIASTSLDLREQKKMEVEKSNLAFGLHYGWALELLGQAKDPKPEMLLMACLLFVLCDEFNKNGEGVKRHLSAGRKIVKAASERRCSEWNDALREVAPIFRRLEVQSELTDLPIEPERDGEAQAIIWAASPDANWGSRPTLFRGFASVSMAAACLQRLVPGCITRVEDWEIPPRTNFHIVPKVTAQLNQWLTFFNESVAKMTATERQTKVHDITYLRAAQMCLHIMSRCAPYRAEDAYDQFEEQFSLIVKKMAGIAHVDSAEVVRDRALCPLYFVASHCRSPSIRRRAVEFLKMCGPPGIRIARLVQEIIYLEESIDWTASAADVRLDRRIQVLDIDFTLVPSKLPVGLEASCCVMSYARTPFDGSNNDVHIFRWKDVPMEVASHASVQRLLRRVKHFEMIDVASESVVEHGQV